MNDSHTLGRWLVDSARRHPGKVAIDDRGVSVTYAELERRSDALAQSFARAGYGVGDRIATLSGNSADHVVLFFACAKAGLALVPLSWRLTASELGPLLRTTKPALVVAEEALTRLARESLGAVDGSVPLAAPGTTGVEATVPTRVVEPGEDWPTQRGVVDDDPVLVIFTSGSEATPKGVVPATPTASGTAWPWPRRWVCRRTTSCSRPCPSSTWLRGTASRSRRGGTVRPWCSSAGSSRRGCCG